jgi:exonuclease VII small subunit
VSEIQPVSEGDVPATLPQPINPLRNPSYPPRIHVHERAHWQGVLKSCEDRIATARQKLQVLGNSPRRAAFERLYAQMLGARDQVADAARRLPGEVGDLYREDRERLEQAVAALDRVFKSWESQGA